MSTGGPTVRSDISWLSGRLTWISVVVPRLADELRAEQENAQQQEASRKSMEVTVKDLTVRQRQTPSR